MTPHVSGTSLDAQARYAAGVKEILDNFFNGKEQNPANLIVDNGCESILRSCSIPSLELIWAWT